MLPFLIRVSVHGKAEAPWSLPLTPEVPSAICIYAAGTNVKLKGKIMTISNVVERIGARVVIIAAFLISLKLFQRKKF